MMNGVIPITQIATDITSTLNAQDLARIAARDYRQMSTYLIGQIPAQDLLTSEELAIYHTEQQREVTPPPLSAGKLVVVLKATRLCNLRCTYCHSWAEGPDQTMPFAVLARAVRQILAIPNVTRFEFVWHGGEITLLKPAFFQKLLWLQEKFKRPGQYITNSMQSNAVHISDQWLTFLKGIGMSVGISLDGAPTIHDSRRVDYRGRGTAQRVALGLKKLRQFAIPYGALIVVDRQIYQSDIREMYNYFNEIGLQDIEFLNIVPDNRIPSGGKIEGSYISYREFIAFLTRAFTLWWEEYRTVLHIPQFTDFIQVLEKPEAQLSACYWSTNCSQEVITLEPNGDVTPCDKYVGDTGSHYGSLLHTDLATLLAQSPHNQLALQEEHAAIDNMRQCRWFRLCQGGCPHDRVINRRHVVGYQDNCCGTGKLLAVIERCLNQAKAPQAQHGV